MCLLKTVGEAEATYPQSCPKPHKKYIYPVNRLNEKEMYLFTEYMKNKSMRERKNNKFRFEIV